MSRKPVTYALLTAVGNYDRKLELENLDSSQHDLDIMTLALTQGLRIDNDNIRRLGEDGTVDAISFARSIAEFDSMLTEEDTFIFFFSGHGLYHELMFSDSGVTINSIVDYVEGYIFDGEYLLVSEDGANLLARNTPIAFSVSGSSKIS